MGRVVHFEINAGDPARAAMFYSSVFGWDIKKWEGPSDYWLVSTGKDDDMGINGGIGPRQGPAPQGDKPAFTSFVCTIAVDDLEASLGAVVDNGGSLREAARDIPGIGKLAYATDTEGNAFGILQPLPRA